MRKAVAIILVLLMTAACEVFKNETGISVSPSGTDIAVNDILAPSSVTRGEIVSIRIMVENTGDEDVSREINILLTEQMEDIPIGTSTIEGGLAAGDTSETIYEWDTGEIQAGAFNLQATHELQDDNPENDTASVLITVNEPSDNDIAISQINVPSSARQGEQIDIEVTVENSGDQTVHEDISVTLEDLTDGNTIDTGTINGLGIAEDVTLTFTWDTGETSAGEHDLQVSHALDDDNNENNTISATLMIEEQLTVNSINPDRMGIDASTEVTISGSGFRSDVSVSFENGRGPDPEVMGITVPDADTITATITTSEGGPDDDRIWDLRVTNPDNSSAVLENAFTVTGDDDNDDDDDDD